MVKKEESAQFIRQMDGQLLGWEQPAARLRAAFEHDHFRLYGQPIVALADPGGIAMLEALVRLHEEGNAEKARVLRPGDFLPAVEHYGMMAELDRWVVRHALPKLAEGGRIAAISVNVSSQTIEEPGFAPFVAMQLRLASVAPAALVIEIDESDALDRRAATERFAAAMKGTGCRLMLDGFARRAVSFDMLAALRPDFIKVEGAVVRKITRSAGAAAKLKAILRAGELTGAAVVAECVEDDKVLAALRLLKVGYAQGFAVGKPQPFDEWLKS